MGIKLDRLHCLRPKTNRGFIWASRLYEEWGRSSYKSVTFHPCLGPIRIDNHVCMYVCMYLVDILYRYMYPASKKGESPFIQMFKKPMTDNYQRKERIIEVVGQPTTSFFFGRS